MGSHNERLFEGFHAHPGRGRGARQSDSAVPHRDAFVVILATMDLGLFVIFMPHDGILLWQMAKVSSHSLIFAESPGRRRTNQVKTA